MFLLMVFFRYFFDEAKTLHWFQPLEKRLSAAGRIESLEIALALMVLLAVDLALPGPQRADVLIAGVIGLVLQLLSTSLAEAFGDEEEAGARLAAGGGLASLLCTHRGENLGLHFVQGSHMVGHVRQHAG
jgi:hypothetical protein